MKRIIVYCRVSSKHQAEEGYSLADQKRRILRYIAAMPCEEEQSIEYYVDDGYSGSSLERPKMKQLIEKIKAEECDEVYIYSLDRLTRRVVDLSLFLELIKEHNVQLISLSEKVDTDTPIGKFFVSIIVLIAQWELETILNRTKRGIIESAAEGNYAKASIPFGYKKEGKKLVIDEEKAEVVRYVFWQVAYHKRTVNSIRVELHEKNVLGKKWSNTSIYKMIKNKIYIGTFEYGDAVFENHSPAIIDKKTFDKANKMIRSYLESDVKYLFRQYVHCEHCGQYMVCSMTTAANGKTYKYYICRQCHHQISELQILKQNRKIFDRLAVEWLWSASEDKLSAEYENQFGKLKSLISSMANTDLSYESVEELAKPLVNNLDETEKAMKTAKHKALKPAFTSLEYSIQREILSKNVDRISVDVKSQRADVILLSDTEKSGIEKSKKIK